MTLFKRIMRALAVPLALCAALAACGGDDDGSDPPSSGGGNGGGQPQAQLKCAP